MSVALEVDGLVVEYQGASGPVRALDEASLRVEEGESWGVVGESGSGKSTLALALAGALPGDVETSGGLRYRANDLFHASKAWWRDYRRRELGFMFQDPVGALDPTMKVGRQLLLALDEGGAASATEAAVFERHFGEVSLPSPRLVAGKYPWELSGGMAQRVALAIALANQPRLLVADEPTSALDATVRGSVLHLLRRLQGAHRYTALVFTHDLNAVLRLSTHVAVMYAGRVVETGPTERVMGHPQHPYTQALLACAPGLEGRRERLEAIAGAPPLLRGASPGCAFADRCPVVEDRCRKLRPSTVESSGCNVACVRVRGGG